MHRDHSTGLPGASTASAESTLTHLPKTPSAQLQDRLVLTSTLHPAACLSLSLDKPIKALSSSGTEHRTWVTKDIKALQAVSVSSWDNYWPNGDESLSPVLEHIRAGSPSDRTWRED